MKGENSPSNHYSFYLPQSTIILTSNIVGYFFLFFLIFYKISYVLFCVWLLWLKIMFVRFINIIACIYSSFSVLYSIPVIPQLMYIFNCPGIFELFQFGTV